MGRLDDLRKLKDATAAKVTDEGLRSKLAKSAGDVVSGASGVIEGAEAIAERSGLTGKDGSISKVRLAKSALRPTKTAKTLLGAAADEIRVRRHVQHDDE
jgi:hypothetical protein